MSAPAIASALAAGATIVTPGKRLARFLVARHDDEQRRAGAVAWPAAVAMPWPAWLGNLWLDALAAGALAAPRPLISPAQAAHLWDSVVAAAADPLLDARGAAAQAAAAWSLFHEWRRPGERVDGWARSGFDDDPAAFARWADKYRKALDDLGLADAVLLADMLAEAAPAVPAWRGRRFLFAGFADLTPQQRRLREALAAAGAVIDDVPAATAPTATPSRVVCATPADELERALGWARERALADPQASIGIAILDLASRRDEVQRRADELLCPELAIAIAPDAARPYGISLGLSLAAAPPVAAALGLVALAMARLPVAEAAALLRSPYLPGADVGWRRRAGAERVWRDDGVRTIGWNDAIAALLRVDRAFGERWQTLVPPARGTRTPQQWATDWRELLAATGWPGDRALDSGEWQAREAWSRLLAEFATLSAVSPPLSGSDAYAALLALATRTVFQPERPPGRIQILGLLEAAGMTFDALWIAGLAADAWPPPQTPDPLLPLAWQRERSVPHADAASGLAWARALTDGFASAAGEVVGSHGRVADGCERAGSALTRDWGERPPDAYPAPIGHAIAIARAGIILAADDDARAPAITPGSPVRGGAGIVESQSACPFQALARYRLRTDAWPATSEGLTAMERGTLLHAALHALWTDLGDHAGLMAQDPATLEAKIAAAVRAGSTEVDRRRWQSLPAPVVAGEAQRLAATIGAWLEHGERGRPPFTVRETELRSPLVLGGLELTLQIDRVDTLPEGGVAIVDYKSGRTVAPKRWFADRPTGTQVGLYALAWKARDPDTPVRAVAYVRVKAGEIGVDGLAADVAVWPALDAPADLRMAALPDWTAVEARFAATLGDLVDDFRAGDARVAPRDAGACRYCDQKPLCRVRALDDEAVASGDADG